MRSLQGHCILHEASELFPILGGHANAQGGEDGLSPFRDLPLVGGICQEHLLELMHRLHVVLRQPLGRGEKMDRKKEGSGAKDGYGLLGTKRVDDAWD